MASNTYEQSNAEELQPRLAQHEYGPNSQTRSTQKNTPVFESIQQMFQRWDDKIKYHCIDRCLDESNVQPYENKKKKNYKKMILAEEKMTPDWGPTHTLDDDDDDDDIVLNNADALLLKQPSSIPKKNDLKKADGTFPNAPPSVKEKSSNGTPDTAEITPEQEDIKYRTNATMFENDETHASFMYNSILGACGTQMSALSVTPNASVGGFLRHQIVTSGDPSSSRLRFSCFDTPCTYMPSPINSKKCHDITSVSESDEHKVPIIHTFPGKNVLERRKNRHQLNKQNYPTNKCCTFQNLHDDKEVPPPKPSPSSKFLSFWQINNEDQAPNLDREKQPLEVKKVKTTPKVHFPVETIDLDETEYQDFSDSISELTMRSSHGEATASISENRRMAYYAVGKHYDQNGGGNRRCYFTGKLIATGCPFYAGCVQQGLRTLVVFCLPGAIGLPKATTIETSKKGTNTSKLGYKKNRRKNKDFTPKIIRRSSSAISQQSLLNHEQLLAEDSDSSDSNCDKSDLTTAGEINRSPLPSSFHNIDLVISDEDDDINVLPKSPAEREAILDALPDPTQEILDEMRNRYPEQFSTLPPQVQSTQCWRLFVRFCFFSGLPIAEGELHYKVKDSISSKICAEEIVLSHDVMEAVNGEESADILRLPNKKTFKYLNKHYVQQSSKLTAKVFDRRSWEMVRAEF